MRKKSFLWLCLQLLLCMQLSATGYSKEMSKMVISDNWEFSQGHKDLWRTATVPGTVHQDLLNHELIPNPFWELNEEKIQWVENYDWEYRTAFNISEEQLNYDGVELFLEGLDTYADVYLNGSKVLESDNMFVGYKIDVRSILRKGENRLHIYFHSPINSVLPQWASNGFNYPADNDHHEKKLSVFTRKAPYSYGWDWGIRMVTSGIWRPISLTFYDKAIIEDVFVNQKEISKERAHIDLELEYNAIENEENAQVEVLYGEGVDMGIVVQQTDMQAGLNKITIPIDIDNPKLWMPNGWGNPYLYEFTVRVVSKEVVVAEKSIKTGLRTIKLVQNRDVDGESFYFEVNGEPMFAKGANFIPDDALLPNVTLERYETLFRDVKEANMNMIRVWGGGAYESDRFYELADENGILVWQDFMFGCTTYPHDPAFLKRVEEEAVYNIKRLRNYASLSLWCGNNEIMEGIKYWGWNKRFTATIYDEMKEGYEELFNNLLPTLVSKYDPKRSYVHGSPYSSNWGRPESWKKGDSHNWGIWYGRKPFESLDTELSRFMSEFGFQSFPEMKTIATFATPEDYQIESDVMNGHQKSTVGNELIEASMKRYFKVPSKFEDFVYVGLVLQGEGMRRGFDAHRRNKPYCMGTLYWQLNDSWPVVSWSSLDYYGNWKAVHYEAQRAFAPIALNAIEEGGYLNIYGLSDLLMPLEGLSLEYTLQDFYGNILTQGVYKEFDIARNSTKLISSKPIDEYVSEEQRGEVFLKLTLKQGKKLLVDDVFYFSKTKNMNLPEVAIRTKRKNRADGIELRLYSKVLVKDLFIEIPVQGARFSDNFFDLLPGEEKIITITLEGKEALIQKSKLTFNHIRKTY